MPIENYVRKNYFKIVIGGDGAVGKTTLSKRLTGTIKADERIEMTPESSELPENLLRITSQL